MMTDLFTQSVSTILVLGAGSLGAEAAAAGAIEDTAGDGLPLAFWAGAHTDAARLLATGLQRKLLLDAGPAPSGPFAERAIERSIAEQNDALRALLAGRATVVLCGSLLEPDGALLLPVLARALKQRGVVMWAVALDDGRAAVALPLRSCVPIACTEEALSGPARADARNKLLFATQQLLRALTDAAENGSVPPVACPPVRAQCDARG